MKNAIITPNIFSNVDPDLPKHMNDFTKQYIVKQYILTTTTAAVVSEDISIYYPPLVFRSGQNDIALFLFFNTVGMHPALYPTEYLYE